MSKKKDAVKREKPSEMPQEKLLKKICDLVDGYNARFGDDDRWKLHITTERDRQIEGAKAIAYGEQYACDIASVALHQTFGYADERQKRFCDSFCENYKYFRDEERKDLTENNDKERTYSIAKFEEHVKAACGKYYEPRDKRYNMKIFVNGKIAIEEVVDYAPV